MRVVVVQYVLNKNRPFHIFVLFNAKHPRHGCEACEPFEAEMEVLAASVPVPEAVGSDGLPVFFARADFEANQQTFRAVGCLFISPCRGRHT